MRQLTGVGLADVLPSAAAAVGVPGFSDLMGIGSCSIAVVCLVDGLGAVSIEDNPDLFGALDDSDGGVIEAAFPTTTSTGLTTLGTGRSPGEHGIVGASFWLPEEGQILSPLHWGRHPTPQAVQPEPTIFEQVRACDVDSITIAPQAYARSGLTGAALRGSDYRSAESAAERSAQLRAIVREGRPSLVYVYWPALDRAAHEFGTRSNQWRQAAMDVNVLVAALRAELPDDGALIVTADHGMVDYQERVWIEDHERLLAGVRAIAGEPRMRHVYTHDEHDPSDIARRWQDVLGESAQVVLREDAIEADLFGPVDPGIEERIGDVLAIAQGAVILGSRRFDERVSLLSGHHGGLTDSERCIPGLVVRP